MKLSTIFLTSTLLFAILALAGPIFVQANGINGIIEIDNPLAYENIGDIVEAITGLLKSIAIGVGGIMIIWSGIMIMTAGGSEEKITKGKKMVTWTVIGLAIVISIDFLVGFIKELIGG